MIALLARDPYAALGLGALLDIERMPYRPVTTLDEAPDALPLLVGADLTPEECAAAASRPAVVLDGGAAFAHAVLGARAAQAHEGPVTLALDAAIWPPALVGRARPFAPAGLRLPRVPYTRVDEPAHGTELAALTAAEAGAHLPAVRRIGPCVWSALDLGTAFGHLLTERYQAAPAPRLPGLQARLRGLAERGYYAVPERWRVALRRFAYARAEQRLRRRAAIASDYPIDASGWLTLELLRALVQHAAGLALRIGRWPAGYRSAAVLTHDLEPRPYAYREGLAHLVARAPASPAGAVGVVARCARQLDEAGHAALAGRSVYCHGLDHRGERVHGRRAVTRSVRRARAELATRLGRAVRGYRSPRLDRSPDLDWALDAAGFTYDSSHPDVDRENPAHFGTGVRLNLPYRPLLPAADGWRASRCLELPLTAPDCIQPLFTGTTSAALRATLAAKAEFVRVSGGLYVALVHAGVFGRRDAERRAAHLDAVVAALRHPETWLADIEEVVDWWRAREHLRLRVGDGLVRVLNAGPETVREAVLLVDRAAGTQRIALPALAPGDSVAVALGSAAAPPAREDACASR